MSGPSAEEINETILSLAKNHPEYTMKQFKEDFKDTFDREATLAEKQTFQKYVRDSKIFPLISSKVINGYTFGDVLGKGSFGEVYKCQKGGKSYAVKRIDETKMSGGMEEYFANSASAKLNSQFLVRYIDKFRSSTGELYVVMELCQKGDLRARIEKLKDMGAVLTEASLMKITIQLILGMDVLHHANFLHRDLKPENVFVSDKDDVKIGDFGCGRELETVAGAASTVIGTPVYWSPEVLRNEKYNSSADMWAVGVLIYELIMLERPQAVFSGRYTPIPKGRCPAEIAEIITALLNLDPKRRPSARELLQNPFIRKQAASLKEASGNNLLTYFPTAKVDVPVVLRIHPKANYTVSRTAAGKQQCIFTGLGSDEDGGLKSSVFLDKIFIEGVFRWDIQIKFGALGCVGFYFLFSIPEKLNNFFNFRNAAGEIDETSGGVIVFSKNDGEKVGALGDFDMSNTYVRFEVSDNFVLGIEINMEDLTVSFFVKGKKLPHAFFGKKLGMIVMVMGVDGASFTSLSLYKLHAATPSSVVCQLHECSHRVRFADSSE